MDEFTDAIRVDCERQRSTRELVWLQGLIVVLIYAFVVAVAVENESRLFNVGLTTILSLLSLLVGWVSLFMIVNSQALRSGVLIGWVVVAALQASGRRLNALGSSRTEAAIGADPG